MKKVASWMACAMACCAWQIAAAADAARLSFVTCPIARETNEILCWLVEYKGTMYFLGYQGNLVSVWYPPMLKHKVIIEDAVPTLDGATECGGRKLQSFQSSVVYEIDSSCDTVLPAEDRYRTPPNYMHDLLVLTGTGAIQPAGSGFFLHPLKVIAPAPPYSKQHYQVKYDFNFPTGQPRSVPAIEAAADYAMASGGRVKLVGYRGAARMSDGALLVENEGISRERSTLLAGTFQLLGVPKDRISIDWKDSPLPAHGKEDWQTRRVDITVSP